ncbi:DUF4395 domain-containing protein [uncultured Jatrophihabitans sp.]|uniref:DUF4395 domain-containing protein n=1 Tax=uncultured Jatrophihabitans sp. TaxID=1610747 RepID=UPI0035CAC1A7
MSLIGFPNPVNEVAARCVAAGVVISAAGILVLGTAVGSAWLWLSVLLAYGFLARVLTGPKLSPLGQLATRVLAPRIGHERLVPGPPKRFAQAIGATLTVAAVVFLAVGLPGVTVALLAALVAAAGLESILGLCLGCKAFAVLMRLGVIPAQTCAACADLSLRSSNPASRADRQALRG